MALDNYKSALVTGASSGIGLAVARNLDARGMKVIAVARRVKKLEQLGQTTNCLTVALDVGDIDAVIRLVGEHQPDVIINNAGTGLGITGLTDTTASDISASVRTNVEAPLQIITAALHGMKERKRGHIVNIGSIAGLYPLVSALYGAGKSAIHRLSQNLRVELLGTGIRVTEICPGRVTSEFYDAASGDPELLARTKDSGIEELRPEDVTDAILFALDAPQHVNVGMIELTPTDQVIGGAPLTPKE